MLHPDLAITVSLHQRSEDIPDGLYCLANVLNTNASFHYPQAATLPLLATYY